MTNRTLIDEISQPQGAPARGTRLSRADWLGKALEMLVSIGVDAVRITRLAEQLEVTRGSFYWHFKSRSEILDGLLEFWERKNTASIIEAARASGDIQSRMLRLFAIWIDPAQFDPRLDFSIRNWGRGDASVQSRVRDADSRRLEAITAMFAEHGYASVQADARARNVYYIQMGYFALDVQEPMQQRLALLPAYYQTYTDMELAPEVVEDFVSKIAAKPWLWDVKP